MKIPSQITQNDTTYTVTSIGDGAMQYQPENSGNGTELSRIIIPDTVTSIADKAFLYTSVGAITIPSSVQTIGYEAFGGCHMKQLDFESPSRLQAIGESAFSANSLTALDLHELPDAQVRIGAGAFRWNMITDLKLPPSAFTISHGPPHPGDDSGDNADSAVPWQTPQKDVPITLVDGRQTIAIEDLFKTVDSFSQLSSYQYLYQTNPPASPAHNRFTISNSREFTMSGGEPARNGTEVEFNTKTHRFIIPNGAKQFIFRWDLVDTNGNLIYEGEYQVRLQSSTVTFQCAQDPSVACTWSDGTRSNSKQVSVNRGASVADTTDADKIYKTPKRDSDCVNGACEDYIFINWRNSADSSVFDVTHAVDAPTLVYGDWGIHTPLPAAGATPIHRVAGLTLMAAAGLGTVALFARLAHPRPRPVERSKSSD
ncbi:leucine-rich repeat domain-containing protein [Bifidobacterium actinocoloniiforme]|uniref:leucine-rich repeat domain-containing protein n=1 Tax=Bifidobacterium actinocoloniiforme TaxID=638619 RepID=UPI00052A06F7|nr:leucine-rich repeat domain-containing protein [Bifidobacterium actinocoloniiforme]AKV55866.1 hypothetical protein AB656_06570 [Bifidobacterium actinocoloniiforme DSM 22766]